MVTVISPNPLLPHGEPPAPAVLELRSPRARKAPRDHAALASWPMRGFGGAVRRRCQPNGDTSSAAARVLPAAGNGSLLEG